jgi:ribosomal protein S12 methylthiotransferase
MRFYITTLGCPKNTVDSEMMAELLTQAGHHQVDQKRRADVLIVNTCGFIASARDESYQALRELAINKGRRQYLVAAGCMAQKFADAIRQAIPQVDAVIGTRSWPEITSVLDHLAGRATAADILSEQSNLIASVRRRATLGATAYLKIADGCDAACAFCAIPLIKGPQRSKLPSDVLREASELASNGVREVILIAQDTTAYGRDLGQSDGLPGLLKVIAQQAPEIAWLRLMYAYPQHVSSALIETMTNLPQVCHYLDLPLQHGHPEVLRRMRRPHDVDTVHRLVQQLRAAMPDIALRSTFIVGFPGETEAEFEGLLCFMREMRFDKVGVFSYSAEEDTLAATMPNQVPAAVIAERYERAMLTQQEIALERQQMFVGKTLEVLVDGTGDGISIARSYREAPEIDGMVLVTGALKPGELVPVRIQQAQPYDLIASPLA